MPQFASNCKYPSHPGKVMVPFTAGTNADFVARLAKNQIDDQAVHEWRGCTHFLPGNASDASSENGRFGSLTGRR